MMNDPKAIITNAVINQAFVQADFKLIKKYYNTVAIPPPAVSELGCGVLWPRLLATILCAWTFWQTVAYAERPLLPFEG